MNGVRETPQTPAPAELPNVEALSASEALPLIEALKEENRKLRLENKKLARELKYEQSINERNRIGVHVKDSISRIVSAERSRLEKYMNLLLANSLDLIMLFDREGQVIVVSDSYLRTSNIPVFGLIQGKSRHELLEPVAGEDFLERMDELFRATLDEKRSIEIEHDLDFGRNCLRRDNAERPESVRHYFVQATPMLEEDGTAEGVMLFFYDTTEMTQAKLEAERARELAEQSTRAKSDFLSRMSHEMRTPMNAIIGMTAIAKASHELERKEYCLEKIGEASTHLLGVINDILDMSRIEANKFELSMGEFDFGKMLQRVTGIVNFRVEEKKQNLFVEIDGDIPKHIVSDEQRLAQVITNLLSNSVKFTPERGSITVTAQKITEAEGVCTLRISVRDTGIGISEEQQKRLFTSFEQADGSISRRFGGTGLGLAISKRIVELMDGHIWIESEPGRGSCFIFEILAQACPGERDLPSTDVSKEESLPDSLSVDGIFDGKRILIAEDVEINREIVQALIAHTGATIDFALDGAEAVEKFSADPNGCDLILMDVQMPGMDGYEATRRIRASGLPGAETIPIVAMTANVFREDIEHCQEVGMNDHLGKPIDADEVIAKLRGYLNV
ncbi:MAG: response regulator [Synergistaceae bacterium]|nr:response regulator [Synergistaceae bacterium]